MDRVKLGRALGYGARAAAKTLISAADAAATPNPRSPNPNSCAPSSVPHRPLRQAAARAAGAGIRGGENMLKPVTRFTSVLFLQVTGSFFTLFAVTLATAAWKMHTAVSTAGVSTSSETRSHFYLAAALAAVFGYFAISSFVRARHRDRR